MHYGPRKRAMKIETLDARLLLAYSSYAQLVGQDDAISQYASLTGTGQTVAVIDTGVDYTHASLGGGFGAGKKVVAGYDFYANDADPMDEDGHGTMVAGAIAADPYTVGGVTYQGAAPDAQIVALRVGTETSISYTNIEKALQWVIEKWEDYGISVVNLSLGSGEYTDSETDATLSDEFETLKELGIFVVAASGNSNDQSSGPISQDGIAFPAADPNVFAVGAVNENDVITSWSQRGDELDLLAPGEDLVLPKMGGGTGAASGTSFASPYVAGVAALIKQVLPTANSGDIGSILMSSGTNNRDGSGESGNTTTLQFARLNIPSALALASTRNATNDSPNLGTIYDTALDNQGVLHAAFFANGKLAYATRSTDGLWSTATIVDASNNVGYFISIAVDNTGKVGISYFDNANTALKYAAFNGSAWTTTTVDSAKHTGTHTSLAFDIDGNAYIAYHKRSGGILKLATLARDAGTWSFTQVDSGNVGAYASIDVVENPVSTGLFTQYDTTVAIAYADVANGDLKYARLDLDNSSATWYIAVVDDLDSVARIDLNLHAGPTSTAPQAQIAYQDAASQDVKYAFKYGTTDWQTETIVASDNAGASVQLTFNSADNPTVVYFNGTKRSIYQAVRTGTMTGTWSKVRIATSAGYVASAYNERSATGVVTWLNRPKDTTFSDVVI